MNTFITNASSIALEYAVYIAPVLALLVLLISRRLWGGWPDLWRFRKAVLPVVARLGRGEFDDEIDAVDERTGVDIDEITDHVPEKTEMQLQQREFVGVLDAPPSVVRAEFRSRPRWWPCWLASVQFDIVDSQKVYEVGSYAYRESGLFDPWQVHVRLTPVDGGRKTALWAHREYSPWRRPIKHYRSVGWSAADGVKFTASLMVPYAGFEPSDAASNLLSEE